MKVFLSWSGTRSHEIAKLFAEWLPMVIQSLRPFVSSDIEKGAPWLEKLTDELKDSGAGVVCLTKENTSAPWIMFEAGALAKGLTKSRVCTFLVDVEGREVNPPLTMFQNTRYDRDDMRKLLHTLNQSQPTAAQLEVGRLNKAFDSFWPDFQKGFDAILKKHPVVTPRPEKSDSTVLAEVLDAVRNVERAVDALKPRQLSSPTFLLQGERPSGLYANNRPLVLDNVSIPTGALTFINPTSSGRDSI